MAEATTPSSNTTPSQDVIPDSVEPVVDLKGGDKDEARPECDCIRKVVHSAEHIDSPIVTLRVGPDKVVFKAQKSVLVKAKFFAACLRDGYFAEWEKNEINFPEDTPGDIRTILNWLYFSRPKHCPCKPYALEDYPVTELIRMYQIAEKYCVDDMSNHVLDVAWEGYDHQPISSTDLQSLSLANSELYEIFCGHFVEYLWDHHPKVLAMEYAWCRKDSLATEILESVEILLEEMEKRQREKSDQFNVLYDKLLEMVKELHLLPSP